jgi:hypothetical protein
VRRLPLQAPLERTRESAFSYVCGGCGSCCYNKAVSVNPYELLRLARALGLSTTLVLETYVSPDDMSLRRRDDGSCVFLRGAACGVHAGRPAACRVFPLAEVQTAAGAQALYGELRRPLASSGRVGEEGTVGEFLERQGLAAFDAPFAAYRAVLARLVSLLETDHARESGLRPEMWIDADAALGADAPEDPEAAWRRHVALLEGALAGLEAAPSS